MLLLLLALLTTSVWASDVITIDELIIEDTPFNQRQESSSSTLIQKQLSQTQSNTLSEVLQKSTSIQVQKNGITPGTTSYFIRGGSSSDSLILVDGIALSDPTSPAGGASIDSIDTNEIQSIRVLRGAAPLKYGSHAISGVIDIDTIGTLPQKNETQLNLSVDSIPSIQSSLKQKIGTDTSLFKASISGETSQGISSASKEFGNLEKDPYHSYSGSLFYQNKLSQKLTPSLLIRATQSKSHLDNFGGVGGDDPNYTQNNRLYLAKLKLKSDWNSNFNSTFSGSLLLTHRSSLNLFSPGSFFYTDEYRGEDIRSLIENRLILDHHQIIDFSLGFQSSESRSSFLPDSKTELKFSLAGIYEYDSKKQGLDLSAGVRFDQLIQRDSVFNFALSPSYWLLAEKRKVSLSAATSFKAPTLFQRYADPFGNAGLKPERSIHFEAGLSEYLSNQTELHLIYFHRKTRQLIDFIGLQYQNTDFSVSEGIELNIDSEITPKLEADFSYTWLLAKQLGSDLFLLKRAQHRASMGLLSSHLSAATIRLGAQYLGKRDDLMGLLSQRVSLSPYWLFDLTSTFHLSKSIDVFAKVDNLFNTQYQQTAGYGTLGRTITLGSQFLL